MSLSGDLLSITLNETYYNPCIINEFETNDFRGKAKYAKTSKEFAEKQSGNHHFSRLHNKNAEADNKNPSIGSEQETKAMKDAINSQNKQREKNIDKANSGKKINKSSREVGAEVYGTESEPVKDVEKTAEKLGKMGYKF